MSLNFKWFFWAWVNFVDIRIELSIAEYKLIKSFNSWNVEFYRTSRSIFNFREPSICRISIWLLRSRTCSASYLNFEAIIRIFRKGWESIKISSLFLIIIECHDSRLETCPWGLPRLDTGLDTRVYFDFALVFILFSMYLVTT